MTIEKTLIEYGFGLENNQIISRSGKITGVCVNENRTKGRVYCRGSDGNLLWSGNNIANFLESFWFAKPLQK